MKFIVSWFFFWKNSLLFFYMLLNIIIYPQTLSCVYWVYLRPLWWTGAQVPPATERRASQPPIHFVVYDIPGSFIIFHGGISAFRSRKRFYHFSLNTIRVLQYKYILCGSPLWFHLRVIGFLYHLSRIVSLAIFFVKKKMS
jgi:hypothetical protein